MEPQITPIAQISKPVIAHDGSTMMRHAIVAAFVAPALFAQTPEQRLEEAWARYLSFDILDGPAEHPQAGLGDAMDELGRAWASWAGQHRASVGPLPGPMNFKRSSGPDTLVPPSSRVITHRGPWVLMGLEVPAPCGTHLFVALFKATGSRWKLAMLDLHEPRTEQDPLGMREGAQALLLDGAKVVIASTPPWCTSCWSTLHARAETPGTDAEHPRTLFYFEDGVYRCAEDAAFRMKPMDGGIRLRYEGEASDKQISSGQAATAREKILRF